MSNTKISNLSQKPLLNPFVITGLGHYGINICHLLDLTEKDKMAGVTEGPKDIGQVINI